MSASQAAGRHHGTLTRWNEDRGFGFIAPAGGVGELFVHVSAFPQDGRRPQVGEVVSYLTQAGPEGKLRAVSVMRPGTSRPARPARERQYKRQRSGVLGKLLTLCAVAAIAAVLYKNHAAPSVSPASAVPALTRAAAQTPHYRCDGRQHCSQMRSCEEATYFLRHCPNTQMDGDGDGVPCEQQWCN